MKSIFSIFFIFLLNSSTAQNYSTMQILERLANKNKALLKLKEMDTLQQSIHWPNVSPSNFLKNIKNNIDKPLELSTGRGTNFCAYGAATYNCLVNEPLRYVFTMLELYKNGKANFRDINLEPSLSIKQNAGKIMFSGELDWNVADQMWYLSLAHKFKGYLNIFNLKYNPGDENKMWAAVNLAKFTRMLRRLCKYKVWSKGSDLIRPNVKNWPEFLNKKLAQGEVFLYLNNGILRKKNHNKIKRMVPTHFIVLNKIVYDESIGMLTIKYWDGDYYTVKEVGLSTFKKIVYGVIWTKFKAKQNEYLFDFN